MRPDRDLCEWRTDLGDVSRDHESGDHLRILVAGPPKTGNVWLEKLLSLAFDLEWIRQAPSYDFWSRHDLSGLEAFIADGGFRPSSICHQHFWPSEALFSIAPTHRIALVTTLRDPNDQFVSWYF